MMQQIIFYHNRALKGVAGPIEERFFDALENKHITDQFIFKLWYPIRLTNTKDLEIH